MALTIMPLGDSITVGIRSDDGLTPSQDSGGGAATVERATTTDVSILYAQM